MESIAERNLPSRAWWDLAIMTNNQNGDLITPADVPLTQAVLPTRLELVPWHQRSSTYIILAGTVLLALFIVFALPSWVNTNDTSPVELKSEPVTPAVVKEAPFQDAQLAKARRASQDTLSQLLEKQSFLEDRNVQLWAKEDFQKALDNATEGDTQYHQRAFTDALNAYEAALEQLQLLESGIPERLSHSLTMGHEAFAKGLASEAKYAYELALTIDPTNADAKLGIQRTETLDQVMALVGQGNDYLDAGSLQQAEASFQQALTLDSAHQGAIDGHRQVRTQIQSRSYNSAMSNGYQALEKNQFNGAAKYFREALALRPGDKSATAGLTQANNASAQLTTQTQLHQAQAKEASEQWHQARDIYHQLLARDGSVVEAKLGQIRSSTRANLSDAINKILASPLRLASTQVLNQGQQLLRDAEGIKSPGPLHQQQTQRLRQTLAEAVNPVAIELRSDNATKVTLFRVGVLGVFSQKPVSLKPGNYIAVGSRAGYRDVRVEFQVTSAGLSAPVTIICRESI